MSIILHVYVYTFLCARILLKVIIHTYTMSYVLEDQPGGGGGEAKDVGEDFIIRVHKVSCVHNSYGVFFYFIIIELRVDINKHKRLMQQQRDGRNRTKY